MNSDGGQTKLYLKPEAGYHFFSPTWFPSGKRIALAKFHIVNGALEAANEELSPQPHDLSPRNSADTVCTIGAINAIIAIMPTILIRQLDPQTKTRLRVRAAHNGRSMEEEARDILRSALTASQPGSANLAEKIHQRFAPLGGLEMKLPKREVLRDPPVFSKSWPAK